MKIKDIIMIVVALFVIGSIIGQALIGIGNVGNTTLVVNGSTVTASDVVDSGVLNLLEVFVPTMAVLAIAVGFIAYIKLK